jgi:3-hydroxybutyryl-CoA dehydrogenase
MEVKQISIIGAGVMGSGIAQISALAGYVVLLNDVAEAALHKAVTDIERSLKKLMAKGKVSEADMALALNKIKTTADLETACKNADLVVECVFENLELKQKMFADFDRLCKPEAILGSNTSAIPITEIASASLWVPPPPGIIPSLISGCPILAFCEAIRMSQHMATSSPPPNAYPFMAAIVGLGNFAMAC